MQVPTLRTICAWAIVTDPSSLQRAKLEFLPEDLRNLINNVQVMSRWEWLIDKRESIGQKKLDQETIRLVPRKRYFFYKRNFLPYYTEPETLEKIVQFVRSSTKISSSTSGTYHHDYGTTLRRECARGIIIEPFSIVDFKYPNETRKYFEITFPDLKRMTHGKKTSEITESRNVVRDFAIYYINQLFIDNLTGYAMQNNKMNWRCIDPVLTDKRLRLAVEANSADKAKEYLFGKFIEIKRFYTGGYTDEMLLLSSEYHLYSKDSQGSWEVSMESINSWR